MATGISLHIGLNSLDSQHYAGWDGKLSACENDAQDMESIAKSQGFKEVNCFLTGKATRQAVSDQIKQAAQTLVAGDIFMLSYSGHGGQLPDLNGDELDGMDETWCLYDGQLIDDELFAMLSQFSQGVRILAFSDSCHSGTVTKGAYYSGDIDVRTSNVGSDGTVYRFMPEDVLNRTYRLNQEFYDKILTDKSLITAGNEMKASSLLISGCHDNQFSADGPINGLFTSRLLSTWQHSTFEGNYRQFYKAILKSMPPKQTPNYYPVGNRDMAFERQKPFTV